LVPSTIGSQHDWFRVDLPLHAPQFALKQFAPAQFRQRLLIGFRFTRATAEQLRIAVIQMLREFLDDGGFARRHKPQALKPPSDF